MKTTSSYIHGSSPGEQKRLDTLNELINASSLREMDLRGTGRVLDVGSGLGQLTRSIARKTGLVVGIERDATQIAECNRLARAAGEEAIIEIRQADVMEFPLADNEWGTFDIVHSRFLLEHVPQPQTIVNQMVRAARPGGRIILEDDDHDLLRLWPEPDGLQTVWEAYCRSYTLNGNDPLIGRKLGQMLQLAGAQLHKATWIFFGACAGEPEFALYVDNLAGILTGAREDLVRNGLVAGGAFDRGIQALFEWKRRQDAVLWYARAWAEGRLAAGRGDRGGIPGQ